MVALTKPMHDLCVRMTTVPEGELIFIFHNFPEQILYLFIFFFNCTKSEVIQQFIQADVTEIDDADNRLKCYM